MTAVARATLVVAEEHTAPVVGSGDVAALATPWLVALCEQATVSAVSPILEPGETTVGVHVDVHHLAASAIGATVTATATLADSDGTKMRFDVEAHDGDLQVGRGAVTRVRVVRARFIERLRSR